MCNRCKRELVERYLFLNKGHLYCYWCIHVVSGKPRPSNQNYIDYLQRNKPEE